MTDFLTDAQILPSSEKRVIAQSQLGSISLNHVVTCSVLSYVSKPRKGQWVKRTFLSKEEGNSKRGEVSHTSISERILFGLRRFFFRFSYFRNASLGRLRSPPIFVHFVVVIQKPRKRLKHKRTLSPSKNCSLHFSRLF